VPAVSRPNGPFEIGVLGKVLDRQGMFPLDSARKVDHGKIEKAPPPTPTAAYGKFLARGCMGCHGETYGGGPIPGAPPEFAVPLNITPHPTGLPNYQYEELVKLLDTGIKRDGKPLDPFMPLVNLRGLNEVERRALHAFLVTLPPKPFGSR
jgi:mono/diheme cytochrome c family protein